jgi:hypothetical protein
MVKGLYRDGDSWVMVDYGRHRQSIPRDLYETRGYKPPCEELPTAEEYNAAQEAEADK